MEKKQIFSIRKLTVGVASVMIGATLLGANVQSTPVKAAIPTEQGQGQTEKPNVTGVYFHENNDIQVFSDIAAKIEINDAQGNLLGTIKNNKDWNSIDLTRALKPNEKVMVIPFNVYGVEGNPITCYYTDQTSLQSTYEEYENRNVTSTAQYKNSSKAKQTAFDNALQAAKDLLTLSNGDQTAVNKANANLQAAFKALDGKGEPDNPGKTLADTTKIVVPKIAKYPLNVDQEEIDRGYLGIDRNIHTDLILIERAFRNANSKKITFSIDFDRQTLTAVFTDGSKKDLNVKSFFVESDAHKYPVEKPDFPLQVANPDRLTESENKALINLIKETNPQAVKVDRNYEQVVLTYRDGSRNSFYMQNDEWVNVYDHKGSDHSDDLTEVFVPDKKITAKDPDHLTKEEKDQIIANVEKTNSNAISIKVNNQGYVRINFDYPIGGFGFLKPQDVLTNPSVKTPDQPKPGHTLADITKINLPKVKYLINDSKNNLILDYKNNDIKIKIQRAVRRANPALEGKAKFNIFGDQVRIIFLDGSHKDIDMKQFVESSQAYLNPVKTPEFPIKTDNLGNPNLSKKDISNLKALVKKLNPKVVAIKDSNNYGNYAAELVYSDGSKNMITEQNYDQWFNNYSLKGSQPGSGLTDISLPAKKITVKDPNHLTNSEKQQIIANLKATNPDVDNYAVNDQGYVRLNFQYPEGSFGLMTPDEVIANAAIEHPSKPEEPAQPDKPANPGTDNPLTPSNPGSSVPTVPSNPETPSTPTVPTVPSTSVDNNQKPTSNNTKEEALSTVLYAPVINGNHNWKIALRDSNGKLTGKYIATGTSWKIFGQKMINGVLYYRLGSQQQWVPAEYLTRGSNSSTAETKLSTTGFVARLVNHPTWKIALYNSQGRVTGYLKPNSNWKVLASKKINGRLMYRLGTESQWIPAQYITVK